MVFSFSDISTIVAKVLMINFSRCMPFGSIFVSLSTLCTWIVQRFVCVGIDIGLCVCVYAGEIVYAFNCKIYSTIV